MRRPAKLSCAPIPGLVHHYLAGEFLDLVESIRALQQFGRLNREQALEARRPYSFPGRARPPAERSTDGRWRRRAPALGRAAGQQRGHHTAVQPPRRSGRLAAKHRLRLDHPVERLLVDQAEFQPRFLQGQPLLVRMLGDRRGIVIADFGRKRSHQHQRAVHQVGDALLVRLEPVERALGEAFHADVSRLIERMTLAPISGLNTFSSIWP